MIRVDTECSGNIGQTRGWGQERSHLIYCGAGIDLLIKERREFQLKSVCHQEPQMFSMASACTKNQLIIFNSFFLSLYSHLIFMNMHQFLITQLTHVHASKSSKLQSIEGKSYIDEHMLRFYRVVIVIVYVTLYFYVFRLFCKYFSLSSLVSMTAKVPIILCHTNLAIPL